MRKKESTSSFLQEELLTRLKIQERSLQAFVKEINENINQVLVLVGWKLDGIDMKDKAAAEAILKESIRLVGKALNDLRNLAKQLGPDEIIRQGFADAIALELDRLRRMGALDAAFLGKGDYYKLDAPRELIIFGTIQGLLCKILVADEISHLQIEVNYLPEEIRISIKFKGSGKEDIGSITSRVLAENKDMSEAGLLTAGRDAGSENEQGFFNLLIKRT